MSLSQFLDISLYDSVDGRLAGAFCQSEFAVFH